MTEFKIDGPGEYRTRDGRKYIVVHVREDECVYPVMGYFPSGDSASHARDGKYSLGHCEHRLDLVAKWQEPKAELPDLRKALENITFSETRNIALFKALVAHIEALHAKDK